MNSLSIQWKPTRISLLGLVLLSLFGLLIYKILVPGETEKTVTTQAVVIPDNVPLSPWKLLKSEPINATKTDDEQESMPGKKYEYKNDQELLEAEIHYAKYSGSFNHFIIKEMGMPAATIYPDLHYKKGIGHYALFEHEDTVYLGSCINAKGEATVTLSQYNKNRYLQGWGLTRTFLWLIGQEDLVEYRCLWTVMSLPDTSELDFTINIDPNKTELNEVEEKLEEAWFDWYSWWKANFPDY